MHTYALNKKEEANRLNARTAHRIGNAYEQTKKNNTMLKYLREKTYQIRANSFTFYMGKYDDVVDKVNIHEKFK